jgi:hypothetical protein
MKKTLSLLILIISISSISSQFRQHYLLYSANFSTDVVLNKNEYLEGEEIWALVMIRNAGSKIDSICNLNEYDVTRELEIENSEGKKAEYKSIICDAFGCLFTVFKPGDSTKFLVSLDCYGYEPEKPGGHTDHFYFPEDNYSINLWGTETTFKVKKPHGRDSVARVILTSIYSMDKVKDYVKETNAFRDFAFEYEGSIYAEKAFYFSCMNKSFSHKGFLIDQDYIDDCKWFIDSHPNSFYMRTIIWHTAYNIGKVSNNKYIVKNFLEDIIERFPGTMAAKNAKDYLDKNFIQL